MSSGHVVTLLDSTLGVLEGCGIERDLAKKILMPLVESTLRNIAFAGTEKALTGTFARADIETFSRHLSALKELPSSEPLTLYLDLGSISLDLALKNGADSEKVAAIKTLISIALSESR
jgi:hypothetical protein